MRVTASTCLTLYATGALFSDATTASAGFALLSLAAALLLLAGLWTPVAGVLAAVAAGWHGVALPLDVRADALLGVLGIALVLLGPGAWSADARLFGWKRLEIQNGSGSDSTPGPGGGGSPPV